MSDKSLSDEELITTVRRAYAPYSAPPVPRAVSQRDRTVSPPRLLGLSLVAMPVAALVTVVVLIAQAMGQPSSAFATWTAVPDEADPAVTTSAADACWDTALDPAPARLPLVAVDQRGRVAVALFSDGVSLADCMLVDGVRSAASFGAEITSEPAAGAIQVFNHGRYDRESVIHIFSGAVGSDVASLLVRRDDGVDVTATVAAGVFVVWWPAENDAATFTSLDAAGNVLETIDNLSRLPPPGS